MECRGDAEYRFYCLTQGDLSPGILASSQRGQLTSWRLPRPNPQITSASAYPTVSCSKRNDGRSGVFEAVGILDAKKRCLMNELTRPPTSWVRATYNPGPLAVRQFGPALGDLLSPAPPKLLRPFLRLVSAFHRGRCVDVESCCWWRAGISSARVKELERR